MNYRLFPCTIIACMFCVSTLSAEPLNIEAYPSEPSQDVLLPPVPISRYEIPQPGDAYFDPPAVVLEDALLPVESSDAVFTPIAQEPIRNLSARKTESFEDWVVDVREAKRQKPASVSASEVQEPAFKDVIDTVEALVEEPNPELNSTVTEPDMLLPVPEDTSQEAPFSSAALLKEPAISMFSPSASEPVWIALEGASVELTLREWTRVAGVDFIWDNNHAFAVLHGAEMRGSFEDVTQRLLDQYKDNQVRPTATLHVSDIDGQKTLVVKVLGDI